SEAPGAQINKQFKKDIKKTADKPKFFGFVDSLKGLAKYGQTFLILIFSHQ
ncbi:MAG: hypothetical protein K0Q87_3397, partial [Neobacillus sp.]|nr:hypothetical protein [Neobacillus sp.]